jgi:carbamoyltransferase
MAKAILGISAFYHDSAAALLVDGHVVAAAQEERFSRLKHDPGFPAQAAQYVLTEAGLTVADLSAVAFYDKPLLKFERLLEISHAFAPRGLRGFLAAMPVWVKDKLFLRHQIRSQLAGLGPGQPRLLFPEHHLSHAASAFYPSPFAEAAILTVDGVGEWATATIGHGRGREITVLRELDFPHSVGLLYSAFTHYCGFRINDGEYKLMGLAPYGNPGADSVQRYKQLILTELVDLRPDGSLLLNMDYFAFASDLTMCRDASWRQLFGFPRRQPEDELRREHMDMALAIQEVTEEILLRLARTARELTGSDNLVMAGGVALNCVANGKLLREGIFRDLWIQPASGDAGGALGAALAAWHIWNGAERIVSPGMDAMQGALLGPAYDAVEIRRVARRFGLEPKSFGDFEELCRETAQFLATGKVVGWFQGRMEYGPRALGNRSILADPRHPEMQKRLNLKTKLREGFRPFAPAVLAEEQSSWFALDRASPYMLLTTPVAEWLRAPLPPGYADMSLYEKLYVNRSQLPAITHVDFSARIQTVGSETNPRFYHLLSIFKGLTGCPVLINTSFNVKDEPLVCSPEDAVRCFLNTGIDVLVMGDLLFTRAADDISPGG